jgi:lactate dehydrogenase-like 2-hydroxyacid dehydrogenase
LDLLGDFDVTINPEDRVLSRDELAANAQGKDAVLCLLTDAIDDELMAALPTVKIFANYAVGFDNIDVEAATRRKIAVTNTPGVLTGTTADLAWALLMSAARRVVDSDKYTRAGQFKGWGPMMYLGVDIHYKTLGIVGMGRIGQAVAWRSRGFDMKVLYTDRKRISLELEKMLRVTFVTLDELLRESDFVSLHVPLRRTTRHLIGKKQLEMMKKTAVLVNTSRGPVVDERALVEALKNQVIFAAGLDVYENEPVLAPGLVGLDNVVVVPHIGSASIDTRSKMATMAAENIMAFFRGEKPPNILNPEVLS